MWILEVILIWFFLDVNNFNDFALELEPLCVGPDVTRTYSKTTTKRDMSNDFNLCTAHWNYTRHPFRFFRSRLFRLFWSCIVIWGILLKQLTNQFFLREAIQYTITVTKIVNNHKLSSKVELVYSYSRLKDKLETWIETSRKRNVPFSDDDTQPMWVIHATGSAWAQQLKDVNESLLRENLNPNRFHYSSSWIDSRNRFMDIDLSLISQNCLLFN